MKLASGRSFRADSIEIKMRSIGGGVSVRERRTHQLVTQARAWIWILTLRDLRVGGDERMRKEVLRANRIPQMQRKV